MNVRVLSVRSGAKYFFDGASDGAMITGMRRPLTVARTFRRFERIQARETQSASFVDDVREIYREGKSVDIRGAMLGETLARHLEAPIREMVKSTAAVCSHHQSERGEGNLVTLHFRAGDFQHWDPNAILPFSYYSRALDFLESEIDNRALVRLVFDDEQHPALSPVRETLIRKGLRLSNAVCSDPLQCDFAALASSNFLVSSPSTFAITAALLGAPKVIHSQSWVSNRLSRGELFWEKISSNSLVGHSTLALL